MPAVLVIGLTATPNSPFLPQRSTKPSSVLIAPTPEEWPGWLAWKIPEYRQSQY